MFLTYNPNPQSWQVSNESCAEVFLTFFHGSDMFFFVSFSPAGFPAAAQDNKQSKVSSDVAYVGSLSSVQKSSVLCPMSCVQCPCLHTRILYVNVDGNVPGRH